MILRDFATWCMSSELNSWEELLKLRSELPNVMDEEKQYDEKVAKMTEILPLKICVNQSRHVEPIYGTDDEVKAHKAECWKERSTSARGRGGSARGRGGRTHGQ